MLFNTLLLTECLAVGQMTLRDRDTRDSISLEQQKGETILLFNIDDESNPKCQFRELVGIKKEAGGKICDWMIFYAKENQKTICFVELKSSGKLGNASKQVIATYQGFKKLLKKQCEIKAILWLPGSLPQEADRYRKELDKVFGKNNYILTKSQEAVGSFLRGGDRPLKGKRKNRRKK